MFSIFVGTCCKQKNIINSYECGLAPNFLDIIKYSEHYYTYMHVHLSISITHENFNWIEYLFKKDWRVIEIKIMLKNIKINYLIICKCLCYQFYNNSLTRRKIITRKFNNVFNQDNELHSIRNYREVILFY